jgi:hypothetical protein
VLLVLNAALRVCTMLQSCSGGPTANRAVRTAQSFSIASGSFRRRALHFKLSLGFGAAQRNRCTGKAPRRRRVVVATPSTLASGGPRWSSSTIAAAGRLRGPTRTRSVASAPLVVQVGAESSVVFLRPRLAGGQTQTTCQPTRLARLHR